MDCPGFRLFHCGRRTPACSPRLSLAKRAGRQAWVLKERSDASLEDFVKNKTPRKWGFILAFYIADDSPFIVFDNGVCILYKLVSK